jgi:hypothetical protein
MNHHEITQKEIVERYVQHRLTADERLAFQEHYFACDECFAEVQTTTRFIAGMRQAARSGILDNGAAKAGARWAIWFRPALAVPAIASLVLAVALGWLLVSQIPRLRGDLTRERQAREQLERENQQRLAQANDALTNERQQREVERARLQSQIDLLAVNRVPPVPEAGNRSQANTPLVILDAVRGAARGEHQLALRGGSAGATIWIEVEPGHRFESYRLQIYSGAGQLVETINGAKPNAYNAVAVTVPARLLRPGKYVVKLSGLKGAEHALVGEYDLNVRIGK